jgi:two-component system alkaline phosphatase synthesis response regulator PhoP
VHDQPDHKGSSPEPGLNLLIIDDDEGILELLTAYGRLSGWHTVPATSLAAALNALASFAFEPSVIILDWQLPDSDGLSSIRSLRQRTFSPILMLTVRNKESDIIEALNLGADDYVVKPFSPGQVLARCQALSRRRDSLIRSTKGSVITTHDLVIDRERRQCLQNGSPVNLSTLEFDLLVHLARHSGRVWTRDELLQRIWGDVGDAFDRAVDVEIGRLRRKLGDPPENPRYIETVRGVGYRWRDETTSPARL